MKGQALAVTLIGLFVALLIGIGVVIPVLTGVLAPATTLTTKTNDNITFTTNNTWYALSNNPVDESTNTLKLYYYSNATTWVIPTARYSYNTSHIKLYVNGTTLCYKNITEGCFYYATYDYQPEGYVTNSIGRMILGFVILLIVVILIVAVVSLVGIGK